MPATYVILGTHTTRHLRLTLMGVAIQRPRPATVIVSIDNDKEEIRELCRACSAEFDLPLVVAWRTWPGEVRVGQVRNNGVRALLSRSEPAALADDWLHFLDGDSVAPPGMLSRSENVRVGKELLVGGRVLLTEEQTGAFDEVKLAHGAEPVAITPAQRADVASRHAKYTWQNRLKPFGVTKMHKPKVLGANHATTLAMFSKVDGYDETFLGAWREDDDFGRRVYLAGGRARVAVKDVCVYHLWHPLNPQKRENWSELPEKQVGQTPWLPRAGLGTPSPQAELRVQQMRAGRIEQEWSATSMRQTGFMK